MKKNKNSKKTNVMRVLDLNNIDYTVYEYDKRKFSDGTHVSDIIGRDRKIIYKTLVTVANTKDNFVFIIPVEKTLNLKKAAQAAGVKSIRMIKEKELLPLTGYVHGGCSPIGMKKSLKTFIDKSCNDIETFIISAGKVGFHVELNIKELKGVIDYKIEDVT